MKKNNILIFAPSLNVTSGVTNHIIPYLKNINHEKFNIDFLVMDNNDKTYNNLIEGYNGKIYVINKPKIHQILKYIFGVNNFFKENAKKYDIIHCHNYNFGSIILHYAKKYKIKTRIKKPNLNFFNKNWIIGETITRINKSRTNQNWPANSGIPSPVPYPIILWNQSVIVHVNIVVSGFSIKEGAILRIIIFTTEL